ncbi:cytochrome P450 [Rickenella mellea]|uniref:Cytochrome P450 n=1 Tax=Rickenella mellea TaxID=50990 RepID=A0A4Y7QNQ6_9AGAM|nr:cytochrome P450 [Rickenella mellea]
MAILVAITPSSVLVLVSKILGLVALVQLLRFVWWLVNLLFILPRFDPLRRVPGPDGKKFENHFKEMGDPDVSPEEYDKWSKKYGKTWRYQGFGSFDYRLLSLDLRAISYILNSEVYEKPLMTRRMITRLVGKGVFATEGAEHKALRKLIAPAFTSKAIRALNPIFFQKADELRSIWDDIISSTPQSHTCDTTGDEKVCSETSSGEPEAVIDVFHWLSRLTFDVIGLAGFDYPFHALRDETEEVYSAYRHMFSAIEKCGGIMTILYLQFPILEKLFPNASIRQRNASLRAIRKSGKTLIDGKKAALLAEKASAKEIQEKDLLSLLLKANLSEDPSQQLPDSDILDQLSNFLFAGSDSTTLAISWCLHYLSLNPEIQHRLRDELLTLSPSSASSASSNESADSSVEIEALSYLEAVIKETLRVVPPAHGTLRFATRDDLIPLSHPIITPSGEEMMEIKIRKGSFVHIPLEGLNLSKDIWGEDAHEFKPDRWFNLPATARQHPGLANLMSFSFGPHACPGWRFSIVETKIVLATVIPQFVFEPATKIGKYASIVTRPFVDNQFNWSLPLKVSKYQDC